jgi:serine/threonine protein kinase
MSVSKSIMNPINKKVYKLIKPIGEGTVGKVYLGEDPDGKAVAIKMFNPMFNKLVSKEGILEEYECLKAVKLAQSLGCTNYLCLVDYFIVESKDGRFFAFIITEYNPDLEELDQYLQKKKSISQEEYDSIRDQLYLIIKKLHEAQISHNDLNMGNVMIDKNTKTLKLIDFGTCDHGFPADKTEYYEKDKNDLEEIDDILKSYIETGGKSKRLKSEK